MAALNPNNTERWYLTYQQGTLEHTITMRTRDGITLATVQAAFDAFMTACNPLLWLSTTTQLNRSLKGTNVRLPQDLGPLAGTYGTVVPNSRDAVFGLAFPGRSVLGHKARVYPIGVKLQGDNNFVYTAAEVAGVSAAITALNAGDTNFWVGIDGEAVNWYPYATSKMNDHYVNKARGA